MKDDSNITLYEQSIEDGEPIELYAFTQNDISYLYTSNFEDVSITIPTTAGVRTETYFADYIERAEITPNTSGSSATNMEITVWKDHPVAKLFQGAPPEKTVVVKIYRLHAANVDKYDVVFYGKISQANFEESKCTLTAKLENWLEKELPNGTYRYSCSNSIFDQNCQLRKEDWQVKIFVDKVSELTIYSAQFTNFEDGYFVGGRFYYDNQVRMIESHKGEVITIRYPFLRNPYNDAIVTPGCSHLFSICAKRFKNTDNFTGFPYIKPTDSEKNPVGKGIYWVDSQVVNRDSKGFVGTIKL
ncbi:phage conserved hypothetical protein BR0599 [Propionispira arboris]|uniref:Bacteriophage phiJL001 Gp84 C-terminal domain-containing protein n=1 Tax=Propionispira arboris TaxID=84035 RepID=A0A1H6Y144_9FIRM|nr:phage BR0599 family protein [Propionispira arboris]SEJ35023.1 phage conserved hypothetical protein BR0599 [Propionispira arboris]